jgi:subtilase family serine protease
MVPALVLSMAGAAAAAPDAVTRTAVADAHPAWAVAGADRGQNSPATPVEARVYLAGRDPHGLTAFAEAVSDPHSPAFKHYLSPTQYAARFGPTADQLRDVRSWLTAAGLTVAAANDHYLTVRGTTASAQAAFGTTLHNYASRTGTYRAPAGPVTVPKGVAADVLSVTGLDNAPHQVKPHDDLPGPEPVTVRAEPCSHYYGEKPATGYPAAYGSTGSWTTCGFGPKELRKAYNLDRTRLTGKGVTVAVVDAFASPTIEADSNTYYRNHGVAGFAAGQLTQTVPASFRDVDACGGNIWYDEEAIDVQAVHTIAPDAKVAYMGAASCNDPDFIDVFNQILDKHSADIVSNSWSEPVDGSLTAATRDVYERIFQQGAAEGIGFYFAPGDCGYNDPKTGCGAGSTGDQVSYPGDSPWATAVGGTSLATGPDGREKFQIGWGLQKSKLSADGTSWTPTPGTGYPTSYGSGSGGGVSTLYPQPAYQRQVVPSALAKQLPDGTTATHPMRVSPDVAAVADNNTGMLAGQSQLYPDGSVRYHETRWGGTSLATPVFAGIQALAQQSAGTAIGFANPQIYIRYDTGNFEDVTDTPLGAGKMLGVVRNDYTNVHDPSSPTTTSLFTFGQNGPLHATSGYDDVTGVGAPSAAYAGSY